MFEIIDIKNHAKKNLSDSSTCQFERFIARVEASQIIFACSKSTIETLEKCAKHVQS